MDFKYNTYLHLCSSYSVYHNRKKLLILLEDIFIQNSFSWIYILCHSFIQVPPKKLWDPFFHASPSTSQLLVNRSRDQISNVYLPLDVYTSHKIGKINYVHNVIIRLKMLINCNSNSVNQREMPSSIQIYLHKFLLAHVDSCHNFKCLICISSWFIQIDIWKNHLQLKMIEDEDQLSRDLS